MIKKNKKLNMFKVKCSILITILLICITIFCINLTRKNKEKELTILLNNEFLETINEVIIDDEKNIYFSKDDIQKIFDETIYFNEAEKELITTYNTHVALLKVGESYGLIDDENIELKGELKENKNLIYIPITDMQKVYDIELEYAEDNNRIIMDSLLKEKKEASIVKKGKVTEKKGFFNGKNLENLIIGDKIIILEENGKYTKVRTKLGNIGYINNKKLSAPAMLRENVKQEKQQIEVYDNYSNISGIYDNFSVDSQKLNVVVPVFFYIDKNSKVLDRTTNTTATYSVYKNWADSNGLQIMPTLTNNENVSSTLLSYSQRSQVINSLKEMMIKYNYIGINIELATIDDINSFYRFILELTPRFKAAGIKVAVTLNNSNLEKSRIKDVVDYVIED